MKFHNVLFIGDVRDAQDCSVLKHLRLKNSFGQFFMSAENL